MAITEDTFVPDDGILRSEMLLAMNILKVNLGARLNPAHYIYPVLLISFHEGGCRVLQISAQDNRVHVRVSRHLNLRSIDGTVPADAKVLLQWMLAKPLGRTSFASMQSKITVREDTFKNDESGPAVVMPEEDVPGRF
ncbi:hypothetical protein PT974_05834 [Cladobotryum mycophilum]|uniref:Uncharacterized protein n=1 Tax=Cladobotryum mycophilum TaxID=491253 RepID=A0ABR0SKZ6_9HYPO